jgi:hypothetical protein
MTETVQGSVRELRGGRMRFGVFLLASLLALMLSAPAVAQEDSSGKGPVLEKATVRVTPSPDGAEVMERVAVAGAAEGGRIEHVLARFGTAEVEDLAIRAGGRELAVERERGENLDKIFVSVPEGSGGTFDYEVSYRYAGAAGRVPLVTPTVLTPDDTSSVNVEVVVPEGRYLLDSFPVLEPGGDGPASASMTSFPSFVSYELSATPTGLFTSTNVYTALALVVIVGAVLGLLLYDRRTGRGEVANA